MLFSIFSRNTDLGFRSALIIVPKVELNQNYF